MSDMNRDKVIEGLMALRSEYVAKVVQYDRLLAELGHHVESPVAHKDTVIDRHTTRIPRNAFDDNDFGDDAFTIEVPDDDSDASDAVDVDSSRRFRTTPPPAPVRLVKTNSRALAKSKVTVVYEPSNVRKSSPPGDIDWQGIENRIVAACELEPRSTADIFAGYVGKAEIEQFKEKIAEMRASGKLFLHGSRRGSKYSLLPPNDVK